MWTRNSSSKFTKKIYFATRAESSKFVRLQTANGKLKLNKTLNFELHPEFRCPLHSLTRRFWVYISDKLQTCSSSKFALQPTQNLSSEFIFSTNLKLSILYSTALDRAKSSEFFRNINSQPNSEFNSKVNFRTRAESSQFVRNTWFTLASRSAERVRSTLLQMFLMTWILLKWFWSHPKKWFSKFFTQNIFPKISVGMKMSEYFELLMERCCVFDEENSTNQFRITRISKLKHNRLKN